MPERPFSESDYQLEDCTIKRRECAFQYGTSSSFYDGCIIQLLSGKVFYLVNDFLILFLGQEEHYGIDAQRHMAVIDEATESLRGARPLPHGLLSANAPSKV